MERCGPGAGLGCEVAEAQREEPSLIQTDSVLQQAEKEKGPSRPALLSASLDVSPLVYLFYAARCLTTGRKERDFRNRNSAGQAQ